MKMVKMNSQFFAGSGDTFGRIESGCESAKIDVAHESAQQDDAVAVFHIVAHFFTPHRSFVDAKI